MTDGVSESEEQSKDEVSDISRAHFMPSADRELHIDHPDEAKAPGENDVVGRLHQSMYGSRGASNSWTREWHRRVQLDGYAVGKANLALFFNNKRNSRGAVHGDDFYVLTNRRAMDHIGRVVASKCKVRELH